MKFARYLEENSQPEWTRAYIQYRGLKKLLKRVNEHRLARLALERERQAELELKRGAGSDSGGGAGSADASSRPGPSGKDGSFGSSFSKVAGSIRKRKPAAATTPASYFDAAAAERDGSDGGVREADYAEKRRDKGKARQHDGPSLQAPEAADIEAQSSPSGTPGVRFTAQERPSRAAQGEADADREDHEAAFHRELAALPPVSLAGTGLQIDPEVVTIPLSAEHAARIRRPSARPIQTEDTESAQQRAAPELVTSDSALGTDTAVGESTKHSHDGTGSEDTRVEPAPADSKLAEQQKEDDDLGRRMSLHETLEHAAATLKISPASEVPPSEAGPSQERSPSKLGSMFARSPDLSGRGPSRKEGKKAKKQRKLSEKQQQLVQTVEANFDESERQFLGALETELARILAFFEDRQAEYEARFELLAIQLQELARHRQEFKAREQQGDLSLGAKARINLDYAKSLGGRLSGEVKRPVSLSLKSSHPDPDKTQELTADNDAALFPPLPPPAMTPDEGAQRRAQALAHVPKNIRQRIAQNDESQREAARAAAFSREPERYLHARKQIKRAVTEFYRGCEILKNYAILNRTGFAKILKKAEKTFDASIADEYFDARVAPSALVTSQRVEKLLQSTEELYAAYFEHGDRKRGVQRLRLDTTSHAAMHTSHHWSVFVAGIYCGVSLCATIAGLVRAMEPATPQRQPYYLSLLRVYAALYIPTIFALLFGLNLALWHRARINVVFIMEWDVRNAMDHREYWQIPSLFLLILSIFFWVSFLDPFPQSISPTSLPLAYIVIVLLILLNPLPVLLPESRRWFVRSMLRVFTGGMIPGASYSVQFRDFFLGDELNSLAFSISSLWFIGCEYQHKWAVPTQCNPNGTYWTAVLLSVAPFLRLTQSVRRWIDSERTQNLHLINAGKYASSILQFFFYIHYRIHGSSRKQDIALWATFGTIYSLYTSSWDIVLDWALLRRDSKRPLLRKDLSYEGLWPWYYFAMVSNIVGRFSWAFYLAGGPASPLTRVVVIAFLEMLRRFQWNFFRLETEHLGHADIYRILKSVPLPYTIPQKRAEQEESEPEKRSIRSFGTLRRRTTNNKAADREDESGEDSSDEPRTPASRFRKIGQNARKGVQDVTDRHLTNANAREYTPQQPKGTDSTPQ